MQQQLVPRFPVAWLPRRSCCRCRRLIAAAARAGCPKATAPTLRRPAQYQRCSPTRPVLLSRLAPRQSAAAPPARSSGCCRHDVRPPGAHARAPPLALTRTPTAAGARALPRVAPLVEVRARRPAHRLVRCESADSAPLAPSQLSCRPSMRASESVRRAHAVSIAAVCMVIDIKQATRARHTSLSVGRRCGWLGS